MRTFTTLFTLLLNCFIQSQTFQSEFKKIDSIITSNVDDNDPGVMVGIVQNGRIIYESYQGLANLQHQVKTSEKTRSNIASTAKQFTALMVLDLALKNQLSLEDDIRTYTPNLYPKVKDTIKIRHLINHTSGIRDYVELMSLQNRIWWRQMGLDNNDIIELLAQQEDLGFKPGSQYSYSNSGYVVLTKIIEKVSGSSFNAYSKAFFEDLGMKETAFIERYMGVIPNRAEPYSDWGAGEWWQTPTITKTNGEGFLYTTLKDQLIYEQALQNASKVNDSLLILSQKTIPNSEITTYGFGLKLQNRLNRTAVHHDGVTHSYHSQTIRFPEEQLSVFIMSNNGNIRSDLMADDIASLLLDKKELQVVYDPLFYNERSRDEFIEIEGQYVNENGTLIRIVQEEEKTYWKRANNQAIELSYDETAVYYTSSDPKNKLIFYKNELILFLPTGEKRIYKRSTERLATADDLNAYVGGYKNGELDLSFHIKLNDDKTLLLKFSSDEEEEQIQVLNRNELLTNDFTIKVERDQFDRVITLFISYDRAKNMRFTKLTNLRYQPKIFTEDGSIQVTTIGSANGDSSDILLTKNAPNGNEIWFKQFGGSSYDKASSILDTKDGYLIIGSTSSYGNGNYDMLVIKTDKSGKKLWQKTYGDFYNEYGYSAEIIDSGYLIKGSKQNCDNNSDINRTCTSNVWFVEIDNKGNEKSRTLLEELSKTLP